ncbi:hypothetical protein NE237_032010 [Protea cynaroides]|uniref:Uncharacterized protein n=1 Tax=Protea cynaroides TaxID=273540 RepID=A0A9Q0L2A2_9MAGN|nr:hypothetical protein NE237_032010 [Protea cynaroides]
MTWFEFSSNEGNVSALKFCSFHCYYVRVLSGNEMSGKRRDAPFCQISVQMGGFSYLDTPHYSWVLVLHIVLIICWRISLNGDMPAMGYIYEGTERAKVSRLFIWKKILFANNIYMSNSAIWAACTNKAQKD